MSYVGRFLGVRKQADSHLVTGGAASGGAGGGTPSRAPCSRRSSSGRLTTAFHVEHLGISCFTFVSRRCRSRQCRWRACGRSASGRSASGRSASGRSASGRRSGWTGCGGSRQGSKSWGTQNLAVGPQSSVKARVREALFLIPVWWLAEICMLSATFFEFFRSQNAWFGENCSVNWSLLEGQTPEGGLAGPVRTSVAQRLLRCWKSLGRDATPFCCWLWRLTWGFAMPQAVQHKLEETKSLRLVSLFQTWSVLVTCPWFRAIMTQRDSVSVWSQGWLCWWRFGCWWTHVGMECLVVRAMTRGGTVEMRRLSAGRGGPQVPSAVTWRTRWSISCWAWFVHFVRNLR